ncbi:hypothetical protein O9X98_06835 [Agrobacterium salinitolerans]|nr:hypothetical protein [Agrobacterium salinitolerans]
MSDTNTPVSTNTMRWIDLSAYEMKMKSIGFDDGKALWLEGGDNDPLVAERLGFSKVGDDWLAPDRVIAPKIIKLVAPEATIAHMPKDDVFVVREGKMPSIPGVPSGAANFDNMPDEFRWIDLAAYGLALKRVIDDRRTPFNEIQGDISPEIATKLGFEQSNDGRWVGRDLAVNPREFKKVFPECEVVQMLREEVVEDRRSTASSAITMGSSRSPK